MLNYIVILASSHCHIDNLTLTLNFTFTIKKLRETLIMLSKTLTACSIALAMGCSTGVIADQNDHRGGFNFKPLSLSADKADWNAAAPWKLPKTFKQSVVSNESNLNIYGNGCDDWPDMNVVNETGPDAGRYMYRTHEVRMNEPGSKYYSETCSPQINAEGGAISVVDLKTGESKILTQLGGLGVGYDALDGIRWTPWGTLLFAEEKTGGRLFEIELADDMMTVAAIHDRPFVGRLAHEGIDLDADGNVYIVDEHRGRTSGCDLGQPCGGGIYRFVPHTYGDLSSGDLYVLGIKENTNRDNTGQGEWLGPIDSFDARRSGTQFGGASYQRPEDLEIIGDTLYVAITEGPRDEYGKEYYEGRVISVNLEDMMVKNFVKAGVNVPVEIGKPGEPGHQTGFDSVDNLAESPDGRLIMIEDNKPSDIWFASTKTNKLGASRKVSLFASLTDPGAEGTGIYFNPQDPKTLYVNIQHSAAEDGDGTWAITRTRNGREDD